MRFYLAHPIVCKDTTRTSELLFERRTGHELINPFYDLERSDIAEIDLGNKDPYDGKLNYDDIVVRDTDGILSSDGLIAVLPYVPTVGTICEIMLARQFNKRIIIVALHPPWRNHPWLLYFADDIVGSFEELQDLLGCA